MIVFDLQCKCGSQFEGWFASRTDFDMQRTGSMISCPRCGSCEINKILSPVAIHAGPATDMSVPQADEPGREEEAAIKLLGKIQEYVKKHFEDVGPKLAEESLKIRYGVAEPRNIRGVATAQQEKMLLEEGIEILKIPVVKKPSDPDLN
jgi:hypothetical protein